MVVETNASVSGRATFDVKPTRWGKHDSESTLKEYFQTHFAELFLVDFPKYRRWPLLSAQTPSSMSSSSAVADTQVGGLDQILFRTFLLSNTPNVDT
jgi:hypothetical protein